MADQHPIIPPHDKVYMWWEEACKRPSSFYEKLDYVAEQAAQWGWQQRDASVPGELQKARDEELQACCEWVEAYVEAWGGCGDALRAARRPKPKSLKEQALETLHSMQIAPVVINGINVNADVINKYEIIRRALESLPS